MASRLHSTRLRAVASASSQRLRRAQCRPLRSCAPRRSPRRSKRRVLPHPPRYSKQPLPRSPCRRRSPSRAASRRIPSRARRCPKLARCPRRSPPITGPITERRCREARGRSVTTSPRRRRPRRHAHRAATACPTRLAARSPARRCRRSSRPSIARWRCRSLHRPCHRLAIYRRSRWRTFATASSRTTSSASIPLPITTCAARARVGSAAWSSSACSACWAPPWVVATSRSSPASVRSRARATRASPSS